MTHSIGLAITENYTADIGIYTGEAYKPGRAAATDGFNCRTRAGGRSLKPPPTPRSLARMQMSRKTREPRFTIYESC